MPKVTFRSPAIAQTVSARIWKSIGNVLNEVTLLQVTLLPSALMQVNVIQDDGLCPSLLIRSHPFITTEFQPCVAKGALKHRRHGLRFLKACESLKKQNAHNGYDRLNPTTSVERLVKSLARYTTNFDTVFKTDTLQRATLAATWEERDSIDGTACGEAAYPKPLTTLNKSM